jgi:hypothetical protein
MAAMAGHQRRQDPYSAWDSVERGSSSLFRLALASVLVLATGSAGRRLLAARVGVGRIVGSPAATGHVTRRGVRGEWCSPGWTEPERRVSRVQGVESALQTDHHRVGDHEMSRDLKDVLTTGPSWLATASQLGAPRVLMSPDLYGSPVLAAIVDARPQRRVPVQAHLAVAGDGSLLSVTRAGGVGVADG